ncbi:MAG: hypothetical protein HYZ23_00880 [Chloroflexi bacterium]|nr:hypothetical protein [Chloroflexota bacterium]
MTRTLPFLLVISLLVACGPASPATEEQPLPTPSRQWTTIQLTQSGGIMGLLRTIKISSEGATTVTDDRADKEVTGQLSDDELSQLNELLASASFAPPSGPPVGCADCFIYTLELSTSGQPIRWEANDVTLSNSGMEPLIAFLRGLIENALK